MPFGPIVFFCPPASSSHDELRLVVRATLNRSHGYVDLFQTADGNSGVRLEVAPSGTVGVVVGGPSGRVPVGLLANGIVVTGRPFTVRIRLTETHVAISLDSFTERSVSAELRPACDNVVVGTGYSAARDAEGHVEVAASVGTSKPWLWGSTLLRPVGQLLVMGGVLVLMIRGSRGRFDDIGVDRSEAG